MKLPCHIDSCFSLINPHPKPSSWNVAFHFFTTLLVPSSLYSPAAISGSPRVMCTSNKRKWEQTCLGPLYSGIALPPRPMANGQMLAFNSIIGHLWMLHTPVFSYRPTKGDLCPAVPLCSSAHPASPPMGPLQLWRWHYTP